MYIFNHFFSLGAAWAILVGVGLATGLQNADGVADEFKTDSANGVEKSDKPLPFSDSDIYEHVVLDYGKRAVRIDKDVSISHPELMKRRENCFIVMSKKDYYLYVYEVQGKDTVMLARYDCAFGLKKGNKERKGDMKTPNSTMKKPFTISQLADASTWKHDFGDGRGNIKAYGNYFLRLVTPPHSGIGIHGTGPGCGKERTGGARPFPGGRGERSAARQMATA